MSAVTPREYLERERPALDKSEYRDGKIVPMAARSSRHNIIAANLTHQLANCLEDSDYEIYPGAMRLWIPAVRVFTYPDVIIASPEPIFEDEREDNLLNPLVLVEILSESTANYDRGQKFEDYKTVASLHEYVLAWQDEPRIEIHRRVSEQDWQPEVVYGLEGEISVATVGCRLVLSRVYRKVSFPVTVAASNGAR